MSLACVIDRYSGVDQLVVEANQPPAFDVHSPYLSVEPERWAHLKAKLDAASVPYHEASGSSIYLSDPDGARVELISDSLLTMYGHEVG